ncbi:MAG: OsmC family protein [Nitrospinota bacterium]
MAVRTKTFTYKNRVNWQERRKGKLSSPGKPEVLVAAPPEFKGHEGVWTPEDLFVAALNTCFMLTFEGTARSKGLDFLSFECEAEGALERPGEEFLFTRVDLRPRLAIPEDGDEELARWCLDTAKKDCLVTHSIRSDVTLTPQVVKAKSD